MGKGSPDADEVALAHAAAEVVVGKQRVHDVEVLGHQRPPRVALGARTAPKRSNKRARGASLCLHKPSACGDAYPPLANATAAARDAASTDSRAELQFFARQP